jgi:hypothetical protein
MLLFIHKISKRHDEIFVKLRSTIIQSSETSDVCYTLHSICTELTDFENSRS